MLEIKNLTHSFTTKKILEDVNLTVRANSTLALMGPSGSGKSTLLDCIAGFIKPNFGEVVIYDESVVDNDIFVLPEDRKVGLVFQNPNLFPHLTLSENVAFGLSKKEDNSQTATQWLQLLNLGDHQTKLPHEISGGEQQRVAIARALAPRPRLCLFDEPFSKLDSFLKKKVKAEVKDFLKEKSCTSIIVTHDLDEALDVGDELAFLLDGQLFQLGASKNFDSSKVPEELKKYF